MPPHRQATEPFSWFATQVSLNLNLTPRCLLLQVLNSKLFVLVIPMMASACSLEPRTPDRPSTPLTLVEAGTEVATIIRDEFDVPHIRAADEKQLMAAWGYIPA